MQGASEGKQKEFIAQLVLMSFYEFYNRFKELQNQQRGAFENCDFQESLQISQKRMSLYSGQHVQVLGGRKISKSFPDVFKEPKKFLGRS
ncbi:MAG: hypothetical protein Ct9H300mP28_18100 [Pseudomonadota bacterium]|nr:MAG: hypothetical protein Ct9H300mP28_18100 [Pseudomonadota bacterium]